eukprot:10771973-Ditylum_brightwellii.AAC.1
MRHLKLLGYQLSVQQKPIQEVQYEVTNLAVDLRDGVRLCRLVELLGGERHLVNSCTMPAMSRAPRLHNVSLAL